MLLGNFPTEIFVHPPSMLFPCYYYSVWPAWEKSDGGTAGELRTGVDGSGRTQQVPWAPFKMLNINNHYKHFYSFTCSETQMISACLWCESWQKKIQVTLLEMDCISPLFRDWTDGERKKRLKKKKKASNEYNSFLMSNSDLLFFFSSLIMFLCSMAFLCCCSSFQDIAGSDICRMMATARFERKLSLWTDFSFFPESHSSLMYNNLKELCYCILQPYFFFLVLYLLFHDRFFTLIYWDIVLISLLEKFHDLTYRMVCVVYSPGAKADNT